MSRLLLYFQPIHMIQAGITHAADGHPDAESRAKAMLVAMNAPSNAYDDPSSVAHPWQPLDLNNEIADVDALLYFTASLGTHPSQSAARRNKILRYHYMLRVYSEWLREKAKQGASALPHVLITRDTLPKTKHHPKKQVVYWISRAVLAKRPPAGPIEVAFIRYAVDANPPTWFDPS